ncbi:hypothetical protein [Brevibacterium renqingii]|uniref:hypothetical protein n=1 Tax=Brevibacterium renqingii TaxID=2776916 RepID=UPI001ADF567D|nr:hypothetical protein [Brevibacterium renqingii]
MSSPQHPTGSGPQPWQDQPPQHPGQNTPQAGGQPPAYGSGPGPYGSAPGQAYGSAPGQYGSAPGQNASAPGAYGSAPGPYGSPAPYGSAPGPYGSAPGPYGSGPGPYGSGPGPYGSGPGPYGSGPGQFGAGPGQFGAAPAPKQRSGPGLIGPLTLRDLFLLFAGLLAFITLFVPYRDYGFETTTLWHWNVADMGALVFTVLSILLLATAVLVNKLGNGRLRIGSLSLDQFISVLSAMAFTYAFIDLLTSAVYWHVGAYLAFFAALIAFFAGVFTMIPFFAREFAGREDVETHPKARPVSKHTQHPAPVANVPGSGAGAPGFAPYGSAPAGAGQPGGPGQPGPGGFGDPGQQGGFGGPDQSGPDQFGQHPGGPQYGQQHGQPGQPQFGQPEPGQPDDNQRPNPYAPPEQQEQERSANAFSAPASGESSDQPVHSTGDGQTYLGARDSDAPQHSQSEPTQAFGFGADREQGGVRDEQPTATGPQTAESEDSHSGAAAAAAGAGVLGGAAVAGASSANADDSERRRGRHAAPDSETDDTIGTPKPHADEAVADAEANSPAAAGAVDPSAEPARFTDSADTASASDEEAPTVVSPAESSDLVSKVNAKSSDTNAGTGEDSSPSLGQATNDQPATRTESTTVPESEEPTQYVPVASYGDRSAAEAEGAETGRSDEETVAQTAIDGEPVPADAGQGAREDGERPIIQAFWFAVPEPREAVDPTTGMPVFTIYPGDWYLSLEDKGSWFKVRDTDGREGILRNIEGIQRG